jgi:hypothetical protein
MKIIHLGLFRLLSRKDLHEVYFDGSYFVPELTGFEHSSRG